MKKGFFVTTPIYYVNANPHIGTAYTTIAADILARYHRKNGESVHFLTGTDEHGQKIELAARDAGIEPRELADRIVGTYHKTWKDLEISFDDFIRTTEERHIKSAQDFITKIYDAGDIYPGSYEGWYCISDEAFWLESQLVEGRCPDCGREVQMLKEENYFFKLSKFQDRIIEHIERNPDFIKPETRKNEILSFVKSGLSDQSISRKTFKWGIPLPFDPEHVMYVWFDALINYISAIGYGREGKLFEEFWPADYHLVGKDILRFHAVIWPAMLMSAGVELPRCVYAHGWLLVEDEKMSKSKGNVVRPDYLLEKYGADRVRYFLMREFTFGLDGNFSEEALVSRCNGDLSNDLGNLLSRSLAMVERYREGSVPEACASLYDINPIEGEVEKVIASYQERLVKLQFSEAMSDVWGFIRSLNRYIDIGAPWDMAKDRDKAPDLDYLLYNLAESLRIIAHLIYPFMPGAALRMWRQVGVDEEETSFQEALVWGRLKAGTPIQRGEALFARITAEETES